MVPRTALISPLRTEGTKNGGICSSSSVYITNARFGFTNRLALYTQRKTHRDGETYIKTEALTTVSDANDLDLTEGVAEPLVAVGGATSRFQEVAEAEGRVHDSFA